MFYKWQNNVVIYKWPKSAWVQNNIRTNNAVKSVHIIWWCTMKCQMKTETAKLRTTWLFHTTLEHLTRFHSASILLKYSSTKFRHKNDQKRDHKLQFIFSNTKHITDRSNIQSFQSEHIHNINSNRKWLQNHSWVNMTGKNCARTQKKLEDKGLLPSEQRILMWLE